MMPKMSQDEVAFAISLKNFGNYMTEVLAGKQSAFGGAGYDIGAFGASKSEGMGKAPQRPPLSSFEK